MAIETSGEANGKKQVTPAFEEGEKVMEKRFEKAIIDAGYYSRENLERVEKPEADYYVTFKKRGEEFQEKRRQR